MAQLLARLSADGLTIADVAPARHEAFDPKAPMAQDMPARGNAPGLATEQVQALKGRDTGGTGAVHGLSRPVGAKTLSGPEPGALPRAVMSQAVGLSEAVPEAMLATDTFQYIEISALRSDGTATSETTPTDEAPSRASQLVRTGDIITSTVRTIRRLSAIITPDQDGHVCSSGFVVLNPQSIAAEVLLTYLRLPVVCELMDLHSSASLYPAISERDLLKLPIPVIAPETAAAITQNIRAAHTARHEAHSLLEKAKRAVEIAIEQGETTALHCLHPSNP